MTEKTSDKQHMDRQRKFDEFRERFRQALAERPEISDEEFLAETEVSDEEYALEIIMTPK